MAMEAFVTAVLATFTGVAVYSTLIELVTTICSALSLLQAMSPVYLRYHTTYQQTRLLSNT
jgi:hypothetical protein